jgi:hypothetical protein
MNRLTLAIMSLVFLAVPTRADQLLAFKVAAQNQTAIILLVSPNTTDQELTALVGGLRDARKAGTLAKLIPPTSKGSKGPYLVVVAFIMSDPSYATVAKLKAFTNPLSSKISTSEKEFGKRVRAYCYFSGVMKQPQELGSLGFEDEGYKYSSTYKKLF